MDLRIDSITASIQAFFHDKWWEKYHFHHKEYSTFDQEREKFLTGLAALKEEIFDVLNESVFLGEYIKSDDILERLESINKAIVQIEIPFPPDDNVQALVQQEVNNDFAETTQSAINLYSHEALKIKKQYSFDKKEYILSRAPFVKAFEEIGSFDKRSLQLLVFFNANLVLASLDHSLTPDTDDFDELLELSDVITLERFGPNKFSKVFRDKCNFLMNKWIIRKQQLNEPVYYLVDNKEKKADASEFTNPLFSHWKDYILSHYEISSNWQSEITESFDEIKQKPLAQLTLLELHRYIKYYKDVNKNSENLHDIVMELEKRLKQAKETSCSKHTFQTLALALSYAMNNEFSLFLEDPSRPPDEVAEFYKKILKLETSTGNYNYFPQFKYFGFLVKQLKKTYEERKTALNFIAPAKEIIAKCKEVFERYRSNADWSEKHYNYVFQLPYEECMVPSDSNILPKIFTASSFVLPLPKDKNKEEFDKDKDSLTFITASVDVYTNLQMDLQNQKNVTEEVEKMKEEIHTREIKSMEILGIFTAVVTFVLGSLSTFKFIYTATQAFLFMFALATSLGFFVFILFIINRGRESLRRNAWIIILCVTIVIIVWTVLIKNNKDPNVIQINRNEVSVEKQDKDTAMINRINRAINSSAKVSPVVSDSAKK